MLNLFEQFMHERMPMQRETRALDAMTARIGKTEQVR
ncbi:hypothetical protein BN2476_230301 [Paraburkholderia piptadeniae]|uniref:Uncharacterized protein n=1 Tax=Paraburkholderia piptadeniae TaxID=1701573 RepID=A0A1N7RXT0_9BURK|nr:hypothetical protein BN2476_230301 [Paraburkholderia piptadeniae]